MNMYFQRALGYEHMAVKQKNPDYKMYKKQLSTGIRQKSRLNKSRRFKAFCEEEH